MSRSRTYRCVSLSEAQRAELRLQTRRTRDASTLAELRRTLEREFEEVSEDGIETRQDLRQLRQRVRAAEDIAQLDSVAGEIDRLLARSPNRPRPRSADRLALARMELELESIEQSAGRISAGIPQAAEVRGLLRRVEVEIGNGESSRVRELLGRAGERLVRANGQLAEAQAAAECRARTLTIVARALGDMGYRIDGIDGEVADGERVSLAASTEDGRRAQLHIGGTDEVGIDSEFTDPGSVVDPGHPAAEDLCEAAVHDQFRLAQAISEAGDLKADRPEAFERPTRGARPPARRRASAGRQARRRRA